MSHKTISATLAFLSIFALRAGATPSGLNNIPTADTTPQGTVVGQAFSTLGTGNDDFWLSSKTGIDLGPADLEFGLTSRLIPGEAGPLTGHAKLAVPFGEGLPSLALGAANLTFSGSDQDRAGEIFGYAVLSHDLGWFRIHGGCALQDDEALPFFGADKTFRTAGSPATPGVSAGKGTVGKAPTPGSPAVEGRHLFTLRADGIMQADDSWLYSAGVLVPLTDWLVLETWGNFPDDGDDVSVTVKLNVVVRF